MHLSIAAEQDRSARAMGGPRRGLAHFDPTPARSDRELLDRQALILRRAGREVDSLEAHLAAGRALALETVAVFGELEGMTASDMALAHRLRLWAQAKPGEVQDDDDEEHGQSAQDPGADAA